VTRSKKQWLFVVAVIGLAALLRFWAIGSRPGYEWDEPVYTNIATHLAHLGILQGKSDFGSPVEAYVYHPPFYFLMLAGWFKLVGAGITSARVIACLMSLVFLSLTYVFMRWYRARAAAVALLVLAFDGWLLYCNRISWMENTLLVIAIAAIWVYAKAVDTGSRNRFLVAGLLIGSATIFKHVGAYLIPVVLLHWLIVGKYHRQHLQLFAVVAGVIAVYIAGMALVFSHQYWHETTVQLERTFGSHDDRGSVKSLSDLIRPTVQQYYIFYASIIAAIGSVALVAVRVIQVIWQRSFDVVRSNALFFAWSVASLFCFGVINLRFPQYSVLVIVPLYLYACVEAVEFVRTSSRRMKIAAYAAFIALMALNGLTYAQRMVLDHGNALKAVGTYAKAYMPPHSLVITEESIGDVIPQPYCKLYHVRLCQSRARYVIIYRSFTEEPPKQPGLERIVDESTMLTRFSDFKATITVYETPVR
jgi:4-amino-4-deoxy-L-arabinose transferase-like glycosyltransferase